MREIPPDEAVKLFICCVTCPDRGKCTKQKCSEVEKCMKGIDLDIPCEFKCE